MKRREERTGPPAASVFRDALSDREPSPPLGEASPARLERVEDEPHLPYAFPETFAYGPVRGADRRWSSSLVAAALSATLLASTVGLAVVGFGRTDDLPTLTTPRLDSEIQGDPVEIAAPAEEEGPAAASETATSSAPAEEAASEPAPSEAPTADEPTPPASEPPPAPVEEAVEPQGGFEEQGGGAAQGEAPGSGEGGQEGDGGGGDEDEDGIVGGGDGTDVDAGQPPAPPPPPEPETPPLELPPIIQPPDEPDVDDGEDGDDDEDEPLVELPPGLIGDKAPDEDEESEDCD